MSEVAAEAVAAEAVEAEAEEAAAVEVAEQLVLGKEAASASEAFGVV